MIHARQKSLAMGWLLCSAATAAAQFPPAAPAIAPLRMAWSALDHPSAVYHAKDPGSLTVQVENPGDDDASLSGAIAFGLRINDHDFKTLSLTPVKSTRLAPGAHATIPLAVTFAGAGTYALRWIDADSSFPPADLPALPASPQSLECIFAPRAAADIRWLGLLPASAAHTPTTLRDLVHQTGVQKFLLDERFAFDADTGVSLAVGASLNLSSDQIDDLFTEAAAAKIGIVLRVTVPMAAGVGDGRAVEAFHQYIADALRRAKGSILALTVVPEKNDTDRATFRAFYLAAYGAAKNTSTGDKNILMLGAGSALATRDLLLAEGLGLRDYVDAMAVTDTSAQLADTAAAGKLPIWVLPPWQKDPWGMVPPAVALAQGAAVVAVPPPGIDRGVVEHLLGGAAWYQTLHAETPASSLPYIAAFQGDGYAVAAIAGLGAGTSLDALYPNLAHTRTNVSPLPDDGLPPYPQLEVGDSTGSIRVVDAEGAPVDCRQGDTLYVPAADKVVYVLQSGNAEDLMSILRSGRPHRLPFAELSANLADDHRTVTLHLTNITDAPLAGTLRLLTTAGNTVTVLAEHPIPTVPANKSIDLSLTPATDLPAGTIVIVELTTTGNSPLLQRTAIRLH